MGRYWSEIEKNLKIQENSLIFSPFDFYQGNTHIFQKQLLYSNHCMSEALSNTIKLVIFGKFDMTKLILTMPTFSSFAYCRHPILISQDPERPSLKLLLKCTLI